VYSCQNLVGFMKNEIFHDRLMRLNNIFNSWPSEGIVINNYSGEKLRVSSFYYCTHKKCVGSKVPCLRAHHFTNDFKWLDECSQCKRVGTGKTIKYRDDLSRLWIKSQSRKEGYDLMPKFTLCNKCCYKIGQLCNQMIIHKETEELILQLKRGVRNETKKRNHAV